MRLLGKDEIAQLPSWIQLAFGAACARRVLHRVEPECRVQAVQWIHDAEAAAAAHQPQGNSADPGFIDVNGAPSLKAQLAARQCSYAAKWWDRPRPDIIAAIVQNAVQAEPSVAVDIQRHFENLQPKPAGSWQQSLQSLQRLSALKDDWDGDGAAAPAAELVASAKKTMEQLRQHGMPAPSRVTAGPDGTILIEWQEPGSYLEIEVMAAERAEWMMIRPGIPTQHGDSVLDLLPQLSASPT